MIVLDTNVVSEMMRSKPDIKVLNWLSKFPSAKLFLSVLTVVELKFGVGLLPEGIDKQKLNSKIEDMVRTQFAGRMLVFDEASAYICAELMTVKKAHTPFVKIVDLQIAATAISNSFAVATRDLSDFKHADLTVINPWTD